MRRPCKPMSPPPKTRPHPFRSRLWSGRHKDRTRSRCRIYPKISAYPPRPVFQGLAQPVNGKIKSESSMSNESVITETIPPAAEPVSPSPSAEPGAPEAPAPSGEAEAPSSEATSEEAGKAEKVDAEQASEAAKRLNERKKTARDYIERLTREKRELERRAVSAESRLQDLEKRSAQRPDPLKYDDPAKYEYDDRAH